MTDHRPMPTDLHHGLAPQELRVTRDRLTLTLVGARGDVASIAAAALRAACRCAGCRSLAMQGRPVPADGAVGIAAVVPLGGAAVNITFTDGHNQGVFPWDYLWSLAGRTAPTAPWDMAA